MYAIVYPVTGTPVTQGSKRHVGGGRMIESARGWREWRNLVHAASAEQTDLTDTVLGPVRVTLEFRFTRPAKPRHNYPTKDLDKLCRAVLDGMVTGGIIEDDKHVTHLRASKTWVTDQQPGVLIRIDPA